MQKVKLLLCFIAISAIAIGCKISYSFTGASIAPDVKSYTVYDFNDRIRLNPTLSDYLAEKLKDKFTRQTSLKYASDGGDLEFEGTIVGYDVKPISVQSNDEASENRLTVRISVQFTNNKNTEQNFDTEFSAYADFSSDYNLADKEDELITEIIKQIVDDIFNKSVANW